MNQFVWNMYYPPADPGRRIDPLAWNRAGAPKAPGNYYYKIKGREGLAEGSTGDQGQPGIQPYPAGLAKTSSTSPSRCGISSNGNSESGVKYPRRPKQTQRFR